MASVGFKLGFTGTSASYAATLTRKLSAAPCKSRRCVFKLCKLDLKLSLARHRMECKNIEYQHTAVDNSDLPLPSNTFFKISDL